MAQGNILNSRELIGRSKAMERLRKSIRNTAESEMTLLIQGETGTGKELVARAIHEQSGRLHGPFVAVNCASLQESLLESELFGHEKGAFTGADTARKGRFELADTGTLFLDEIGEISNALQVKLLRVLQERVIERVGGQKSIRVDFRLIAATNRNLEKMVHSGKFREDFYYRLNVGLIETPPLRQRTEDIEELTLHFARRYQPGKGPAVRRISPDVLDLFQGYRWPGNVRELENEIQWAAHNCVSGVLERQDLSERLVQKAVPQDVEPRSYDEALQEASKELCIWALAASRGNGRKAARLLELDRSTFSRIAKDHGLRSTPDS